MRKLTFLAVVCMFMFFAQFSFAQWASDQQGDVFIGGGTLLSSGSSDASANNSTLPAEKGGLYINLGGDVIFLPHRLGISVETSWRGTQGAYVPTFLNYRPILTDFNLLYQPRLGKKLGLDLTAGIGPAVTRYYQPGPSTPGYANYVSSDHFMEHLGAGIRYYPWHHIFVRPEINYYHIQNNDTVNNYEYNFNSNNVIRVGASVGFTLGGKD